MNWAVSVQEEPKLTDRGTYATIEGKTTHEKLAIFVVELDVSFSSAL
jgi:hypothetical protein